MARIESGRVELDEDYVKVSSILEEFYDVFEEEAQQKGITFLHEDNVVHQHIICDGTKIREIMVNLLSNAIKFSYNDSEILVNAEIEGDKVIVSVKDTGKGMSEEDQKKLLNTETHFSKYGTNNEEGSGLGLLLCQDFAVKNGGHLWFESEEGKGSTFFFSVALKK